MRGRIGLATLLVLLSGTILSCTIEPRSSSPRVEAEVEAAGSPPLRWSMEKWRDAHEEAEAAMLAPMGDKRIARCEAFLQKYPDYPEPEVVLRELIDAILEKDRGKLDYARLNGLLQRMLSRPSQYYTPDFVLDWYYLKHSFPPEMAEPAVARVRQAIDRDRKALALESDPRKRREAQGRLDKREFNLSIAEGRILIARHEYAAAIRKLLEAEAADSGIGSAGLTLVAPRGVVSASLPNGTIASDRLNLALAAAYAGTGKRAEAMVRLERVRNFSAQFYPDVGEGIEAVRKELSLQPPEPREVRSDPKPSRDFRFKDLQGRQVALSDFRGRVVLAMFWSTW
ncbi:MAG TPA: hypothetical protein VFW45_17100 [Candidatus Polarisedimenticolia bacterium]|nr:hypothetical protein [Candidatus Polarisedimenticolia bacterium]